MSFFLCISRLNRTHSLAVGGGMTEKPNDKMVKFLAPPPKSGNGTGSDSLVSERLTTEVRRRHHTMERDRCNPEHRFLRRSVISDSNATALDLPLPSKIPVLAPTVAPHQRPQPSTAHVTSIEPGVTVQSSEQRGGGVVKVDVVSVHHKAVVKQEDICDGEVVVVQCAPRLASEPPGQIGRASCRERV